MTDVPSLDTPATAATCVQCAAPLTLHTHESIQVLNCDAGHGMFLHADALRVAVRDRTVDRPIAEEQAAERVQGATSVERIESVEQPRACPTCRRAMEKRVYAYESGVTMDVCVDHGIWLDHGELEQIEAWYEAQERYREADRAAWGGDTGKLEQIEESVERQRAEDVAAVHWGPVGWFAGRMSWWRDRLDD